METYVDYTKPLVSSAIAKEEVKHLHFVKYEVLKDEFRKKERMNGLLKAMILGNAYHGKIKLTFETAEGIKHVETTVWATTDKEVTLKSGTVIPIHCIHDVGI